MAAARAVPLIIGEHRLEDCIGRGTDATIWRATHLVTNQVVVAKVVDARQEARRQRALSEASILASLPASAEGRIIGYYGCEEIPREWVVLFLEYASMGNLASFIHRYGRLDEDLARCIFRQLVEALAVCHEAHIVHHDVKLENVLITDINYKSPGFPVPSLRLIDFGLAVTTGSANDLIDNHFAGSPLYMAPEIFAAQPHSQAVDVWSLGVCLYVMITDTFPFVAETYNELVEKVIFEDIRIPYSMGLSDNLQDLLHRMLEKDPARRITLQEIQQHSWYFGSRWSV